MKDNIVPKYVLISYLRNKKRQPKGMLVSVKKGNNGGFEIGYSMCRKEDTFNKNMGLKIALGRAENESVESFLKTPHAIRKMLTTFVQRCERYYKVSP